MLFNSIEYVIFLPLVIAIYYLIPSRFRWVLLLMASYFFYMSWKVEYLSLIIFSTLIDYSAGILMSKKTNKKSRLPFLVMSLCTNLGLLFFFKYYNFASENLNSIFSNLEFGRAFPMMEFLLPVGISFYTFQTISYSIDVYNGQQRAEKHLGYFALYVSFFPQLVAGPIERFSSLAPQLKSKFELTYKNFTNGLRLILYGLFIKMVVADNLAIVVNTIYESPLDYKTSDILIGLFFYSFQIYCDFYGYSLIAIGSALLIGIKLMDNFKTPYLSTSISEFWQRWHISLSSWFRDYLYFPLGGDRVKRFRWIINIFIVFAISGIWHGANWTFFLWGVLFGWIYMIENAFRVIFNLKKDYRPFSLLHFALSIKTFILVTLLWVFFRSKSTHEAMQIFSVLISGTVNPSKVLQVPYFVWIWLSLFILIDILLYNKRFDSWLRTQNILNRWAIYSLLIFGIIKYAATEEFPFIYFQF